MHIEEARAHGSSALATTLARDYQQKMTDAVTLKIPVDRLGAKKSAATEAEATVKKEENAHRTQVSERERRLSPLRLKRALGVRVNSRTGALFSPDSSRILTASGRNAQLWDVETGALLHSFSIAKNVKLGSNVFVSGVSFSRGAKEVILTTADSIVGVYDIQSGAQITQFSLNDGDESNKKSFVTAEFILHPLDDGTVNVHESLTGRLLFQLSETIDELETVSLSRDGGRLLTLSGGNVAKVWDTGTGKKVREFNFPFRLGHAAAISSNGSMVAVGASGESGRLWNVDTGALLGTLSPALHLQFSADGAYLIKANRLSGVEFLEIATMHSSRTVRTGAVAHYPQESPDARWLTLVNATDEVLNYERTLDDPN